MKTAILRTGEAAALPRAVEVLQAGGLVAFPTDTVYGLGALAFSSEAILRIFAAKGRASEKAIPVLLASVEELDRVAADPPPMALRLAKCFWPGPLTLVVRRRPGLPEAISATDTLGVRVPDHPVALSLLAAAGPLAVTSANRSGSVSPRTAAGVLAELEGRIDLILDGGETPGGVPSTVVDCTGDAPVILREGPLRLEDLVAALA
jgi:L-threonylcarbamoyladenylate synthase